ncbi:MAG: hypothetical protein IT168_16615 [Bryobacterales bacterium]|nr:hypothetical protein [Bryobacterales bacterium]
MQWTGDRRFVEIPGTDTLQLPPLLVKDNGFVRRLDKVVDLASKVIDKEDWVPTQPLDALASDSEVERRKMDLALNIVDQYLGLMRHWHWGDGILEWIRQCEITFESKLWLRGLLRPDVWPHAGRSSFVTLLEDKHVRTDGIELEKAVGLRLTFRQPPPISYFSDQFLFYLNGSIANTAYQTWANMSPDPTSSLPPERFQVDVVPM